MTLTVELSEVPLHLYQFTAGLRALSRKGELRVRVVSRETEEEGGEEEAVFVSDGEYRGFSLHSAGNLLVTCENDSDRPARVRVAFKSEVLDQAPLGNGCFRGAFFFADVDRQYLCHGLSSCSV